MNDFTKNWELSLADLLLKGMGLKILMTVAIASSRFVSGGQMPQSRIVITGLVL